MPFSSKAQQHYLFAKKPALAKEFASKTPSSMYGSLPGHVSDPGDDIDPLKKKKKGFPQLNNYLSGTSGNNSGNSGSNSGMY